MAKQEIMTVQQFRAYAKTNPTLGRKKGDVAKNWIIQQLKNSKLPYKSEFKFSPNRRFRFDWVIMTTHCRIGLEYEGIFSHKSGHTTVKGYSKDTEKYNLAQSLGWKVFRYTALTYKNMMTDVLKEIELSTHV